MPPLLGMPPLFGYNAYAQEKKTKKTKNTFVPGALPFPAIDWLLLGQGFYQNKGGMSSRVLCFQKTLVIGCLWRWLSLVE